MAAAIVDEERSLPKRHLIAQNYCNFLCSPKDVDSNVAIMNFHYAYPEVVRVNWNWGRPVSYDESGFLTVPADTGYRKQAWNFLIAGGAVYDGLDLTFYPQYERGDLKEPNGPAGGGPELRRQLGLIISWLSRFDPANLAPANHVIRKAPGAVARALADPGEIYAVYLDGEGPTPLELDVPAGTYSAEWYHPSSGKAEPVKMHRHPGGSLSLLSPAYTEDLALLVRRVP
jgi:hypothetical protein